MGLKVSTAKAVEKRVAEDESEEEFERRIYDALMGVARASSSSVRSALGACVVLGRTYEQAGREVKDTIRAFIEAAEL